MLVALFATAYFPTVEYVRCLLQFPQIAIEACEHFPKQTNRNRCHILGPNGVQTLSIPLAQAHAKSISGDMLVSNSDDWKTRHWRSIETAYNRSAFFEFYKDELSQVFFNNEPSLLLFNQNLLNFVLSKLKQQVTFTFTTAFETNAAHDHRHLSNQKNNINTHPDFVSKRYPQVFGYKYDFSPNLSVLDLLMNCGKDGLGYLRA